MDIIVQQMIHIEIENNFKYGVRIVVESGEIRGYQKEIY